MAGIHQKLIVLPELLFQAKSKKKCRRVDPPAARDLFGR